MDSDGNTLQMKERENQGKSSKARRRKEYRLNKRINLSQRFRDLKIEIKLELKEIRILSYAKSIKKK